MADFKAKISHAALCECRLVSRNLRPTHVTSREQMDMEPRAKVRSEPLPLNLPNLLSGVEYCASNAHQRSKWHTHSWSRWHSLAFFSRTFFPFLPFSVERFEKHGISAVDIQPGYKDLLNLDLAIRTVFCSMTVNMRSGRWISSGLSIAYGTRRCLSTRSADTRKRQVSKRSIFTNRLSVCRCSPSNEPPRQNQRNVLHSALWEYVIFRL